MKRIRLHRLSLVAALSLPLMQSQDGRVSAEQLPAPATTGGQVIQARSFLGGLGVNAHVSWPDHAPYSATDRVVGAMAYLGVRNLRDYVNSSTFPVFERLAASGVSFNLLLNPKVGLNNYIGWARRLETTYPGSVVALEGPNEVDKWPVEFLGLSGFEAATATQKALYRASKADAVLRNVPVYNLTVSGISRPNSKAVGDLSAYADYATVHPYYRAGQQSWGHSLWDARYTLKNYLASARWSAPGRPVAVTETGSSTSPGSAIGVNEDVQARQILNSLFSNAKHGVRATYIYELANSHNAGPKDIESHYGLFRYNWTPKPAAHALHNLTRILGGANQDGQRRKNAGPAPRYTLSGMPATGSSLVLVEDDGTYNLVIWAEPDPWDEDANRPIPVDPVTVQVGLAATYRSIGVYDPMVGKTPLRNLGPTNKVTISLTDHPIILKLAR